jgi:hypothetical protein
MSDMNSEGAGLRIVKHPIGELNERYCKCLLY